MKIKNALIVGSSGFIGANLVKRLKDQGYFVVGSDIVAPQEIIPDRFIEWDWRHKEQELPFFDELIYHFDEVYALHCLMGGMGFIGDEKRHGYDIAVGSTQMIANLIWWCKRCQPDWTTVFYSSSACVYNQNLQETSNVTALKESDAIPANPDLLYGWQKLFSEKMFQYSGLNVRIARFHNIFGEHGIFDGGKEKAPAAICRKAAMAKDGDSIEIWGSGQQTRSFLYIDECLQGIEKLMASDYSGPINIGSDELISINDLAKMVIEVSGKKLSIKNVPGNVGVMGRNSDNTLIKDVLNWRPSQPLRSGIEKLYSWVNKQINGNV